MYHYVRPIKGSKYPNIKGLELSEFKNQIQYLKNNKKKIIGLEEFDFLKNKGVTNDDYVLLTFDDGYADIYEHVFPVLSKEKISGAFFIPVNIIKSSTLLDVNIIHYLLSKTDSIIDEYNVYIKDWINTNKETYQLSSYQNYVDNIDKSIYRYDQNDVVVFKRLLQNELPQQIRSLIIDELLEKYMQIDKKTLHDEWYVNEDQLNCMIRNGMSIGGHGKSHRWLNYLQESEQYAEIKESKVFIESLEPQRFLTFAYPYGGYNQSTIKILSELDFNFSFTTKLGSYDPSKNGDMEIPRFDTNDFPKQ